LGLRKEKLVYSFIQENISHWAIHYSSFIHIYATYFTMLGFLQYWVKMQKDPYIKDEGFLKAM
jgi:hypothetical protein